MSRQPVLLDQAHRNRFAGVNAHFYYGGQCIRFLANRKWVLNGYKIIYILFAFLGSIGSLSIVWDFADLANGLMVIPNVISLLLLHKVVVGETRKYLWSGRLDEDDPACTGRALAQEEKQ